MLGGVLFAFPIIYFLYNLRNFENKSNDLNYNFIIEGMPLIIILSSAIFFILCFIFYKVSNIFKTRM